MSNEQTAACAILAGGRSRRMGRDKALLRPTPDGPTLIEVIVALLAEAGFPPPIVVADAPGRYGWLSGITEVTDELPGSGALGGILTALAHSPAPRTLIVACDMPLMNPALLRYMAALSFSEDALVPRWTAPDGSMHVEPLHAIYTARCLRSIRRRIEAGQLKVTDALNELDTRYLEEPDLRRHDPHLSSFRNVNTPEEWARLLNGSEGY